MRISALFALTLTLSACGGEAADKASVATIEAGAWIDGERSGLCIAQDQTAAFILYRDEGDANCMAQGKVEAEGDNLLFKPRGDDKCEIVLSVEGDRITFGPATESCSYYCGGEISLASRAVNRSNATSGALVDPAGDSIC